MVFEKVREILCDQLDIDPDEITLDTNIIDDLGADSLDLVGFVISLEDELDKEIPDEDVEKITVEIKGIENNELYNADIDLKINDNNLDINKFTCGILKESVFAMISTLKVDEEINEIKIDVEV